MLKHWRFVLYQWTIHFTYHIVKANLCQGGQDIFASIKENSPTGEFVANLNIFGDLRANSIRLCLTGENADWFFLEGKAIRLNTSFSRVLDREVQGSVLIAALTCYEDDTKQSEYRVMVEILDINDNRPTFLAQTIQSFNVSELTSVNTVAFTVQARDADGDTIMYVIDKSLPDASYFRIDLPNSGQVILAKRLDYETKSQLQLVISAVEMNTKEKYNATTTITVNVLDGDDQYPHFLPCTLLAQDKTQTVCTSPIYTVNITEMEQDTVLHFSPGPIHAVDGDKGLRTPLLYSIVSGADNGRFSVDNQTGEIVLTRRVENRLLTPMLRLRIMASQIDDPKKYTVATALIRVLAENRFPPQFNRTTYKGFVVESSSPATLVSTYGNVVLVIQAIDYDFKDGVNPKINYSLRPQSNNTKLYHITQEGLLIAKANQLSAFDKHSLQVFATDQESGDIVKASIDIEVLQKGQQVPSSPFREERLNKFLDMDMYIIGGIAGGALLLLVAMLFLFLKLARQCGLQQDTGDRVSMAMGKHLNVVDHGAPTPREEDFAIHSEAFSEYDETGSVIHGQHGIYSKKEDLPLERLYNRTTEGSKLSNVMEQVFIISEPMPRSVSPSMVFNGKMPDKLISKSIPCKGSEADLLDKESIPNKKSCLRSLEEDNITVSLLAGPASKPGFMGKEEKAKNADLKLNAAISNGNTASSKSSKEQVDSENEDDEDDDDDDDDDTDDDDNNYDDNEEDYEDLENPYKSMHPVICVTDDEEQADDGSGNRPRYKNKRWVEQSCEKKNEEEDIMQCKTSSQPNVATMKSAGSQLSMQDIAQRHQEPNTTQARLLFFVEDSIEF